MQPLYRARKSIYTKTPRDHVLPFRWAALARQPSSHGPVDLWVFYWLLYPYIVDRKATNPEQACSTLLFPPLLSGFSVPGPLTTANSSTCRALLFGRWFMSFEPIQSSQAGSLVAVQFLLLGWLPIGILSSSSAIGPSVRLFSALACPLEFYQSFPSDFLSDTQAIYLLT